MVTQALERAGGWGVVSELVGERAPTLRARRRMALGTLPGIPLPDEPRVRSGAEARHLRVRLVELVAHGRDAAVRAAAVRHIVQNGSPLPAGVLRALASLARDADPRVRRAASTTLVHLLEVLPAIERSEMIGRLAISSSRDLRLLVALALRYGAIAVGGLSALEHLVDDGDADVRTAALVSARLRLGDAPARMLPLLRRKLGR